MAISRFKTSTLAQGLPKYQKLWDGTSVVFDSDFELIERITVGASAVSTITFSSIPQTYKHLQIRGIARNDYAGTDTTVMYRANGDATASNYYGRHLMVGGGTYYGSYADTGGSFAGLSVGATTGDNNLANTFAAQIVDILDYTNTNKYKTARTFNGVNVNTTGGSTCLASSLWMNTAAITSLTIASYNSGNFVQGTSFAIYGIKGA